MTRGRRDALLGALGCLLVAAALAAIWLARLVLAASPPVDLVSELGAQGEPTAGWFMAAMLALVAGGALIAWTARGVRGGRVLAVDASVSLWVSSGFFLFASQVTYTPGCPLPYGPTFVWRDFLHLRRSSPSRRRAGRCCRRRRAPPPRDRGDLGDPAVLVGGIAATGSCSRCSASGRTSARGWRSSRRRS